MTTHKLYETGKELMQAVGNESPGILQHNISLIIGTQFAKLLFSGKHHGPVGLLKFAPLVKMIVTAANNGDTHAKEFLVNLDNMISKVRRNILVMLKAVEANEAEHPKGIVIDKPTSSSPITVRLQFNTEQAYLAAFMLAECDELVRVLVRQVEVGFLSRAELHVMLKDLRWQVHRVLSLPVQWGE